jgi:hypothetical protein
MATRKKKEITADAPVGKSRKKTLENNTNSEWPKVNKGSHLTVTTFEDGRTELIWDDEALEKDVRDAIAKAENT